VHEKGVTQHICVCDLARHVVNGVNKRFSEHPPDPPDLDFSLLSPDIRWCLLRGHNPKGLMCRLNSGACYDYTGALEFFYRICTFRTF